MPFSPSRQGKEIMADKKFIGFYCTPTQARKIRADAKKEGRSVSSYIRARVLLGVNTPKEAAQ